MLKIYDDNAAENICEKLNVEAASLDAHIEELQRYGKLPEIVASMQARKENAERVSATIRIVNNKMHIFDEADAGKLESATEKLKEFSQRLQAINSILESTMKLQERTGEGVERLILGVTERIKVYEVKTYAIKYLEGLGIKEDTELYQYYMKELDLHLQEDEISSIEINNMTEKQCYKIAIDILYCIYVSVDKGKVGEELKELCSKKPKIKEQISQINKLHIEQSTKDLIKEEEGIFETVVSSTDEAGNTTYSIGYGCDFTEKSAPELYQLYVEEKRKITELEADGLLTEYLEERYVSKVNELIESNGLILNQNQYDVLISYYYNNGENVFSDENCNPTDKTGKNRERAIGRGNLRNYLITENGNYESEKIKNGFLRSYGPNLKYAYEKRRSAEAELFNKSEGQQNE